MIYNGPVMNPDILSTRQREILDQLIKEYINSAEPISSELLRKKASLDVSSATIRNELQELTEKGFVTQPHKSAGRVPTEKGYKLFIEITFSGNNDRFPDFIVREVENTRTKIEKELQLAKELIQELEQIHSTLNLPHYIEESSLFDVLRIVGPSRISYKKNVDIMRELLDGFENF